MATRLFLSLCVLSASAFSLAQPATAPSDAAHALISDVLAKLSAWDFIEFQVAFRHEGGAPGAAADALTLHVSMTKRGQFSVRAVSDGRELCGIVSDGERVTEWDSNTHQWTRYPMTERLGGPRLPRLIVDRAGTTPVNFALSRYVGSWLAKPSPYEWFLQRLQMTDEIATSVEVINGARCRVLEGTQTKQGGPVPLNYKIRCLFDEKALFPISEEISAFAAAPVQSLASTYSFRYSNIRVEDVESFDWQPASDYTFVQPDSLRAPTPVLVGQSVADWKVKTVDGADLPLVPEAGAKHVLVIVWATWCVPCKLEMAAVEKLIRDEGLKNVHVLAVSIDRNIEDLRSFIKAGRVPFSIGYDPAFCDKSHASGVPTMIVIDRSGIVRDMWTGWSDTDDDVHKLKSALERSGK